MNIFTRIGASAILLGFAFAPVPADAQSAYDGTYMGVARKLTSDHTRRHDCGGDAVPGPLTVAAGAARYGSFTGQVSSTGQVTMQSDRAFHFDGQIDPSGSVTGTENTYYCSYALSWRKR